MSNDEDWEKRARTGPYFSVLTEKGFVAAERNETPTPEFWATGDLDVSQLLSAVGPALREDLQFASALDFGCGVGRLTIPLARRARKVVACDVAATMLAHVRRNAAIAGLENITAVENGALAGMPDGTFDFVCSLLVFQYIPRSAGYVIIKTLLRLLTPTGIAVLHLRLARPREALRQLCRVVLARSPKRPSVGARNYTCDERVPTYDYDERVILRTIDASNARVISRLSAGSDDNAGFVLIIQKSSGTSRDGA